MIEPEHHPKLRCFLSLSERGEPRAGINFKTSAMKCVRSGLGDVVYDSAHIAAVLSAHAGGENLDFLDCILVAEKETWPANRGIVVRLSVNLRVVRPAPLAIDRIIDAVGVRIGIVMHIHDPRRREGEVVHRSCYRGAGHLFALDRGFHLRGLYIEQLSSAFVDLNHHGGGSQLQRLRAKVGNISRNDLHVANGNRAKAGRRDRYRVCPQGHIRELELPGTVRLRLKGGPGRFTHSLSRGGGDDRAGLISHGATYASGDNALRVGNLAHTKEREQHSEQI